jgi:Ca2+-binding EF-hand superfamily protein
MEQKHYRKKMSKVEEVDNAVDNILKKYGQNQDDSITFNDFLQMINDLHLSPNMHMPPHQLKPIFEVMDVNHDGKVSREELMNALLLISNRSY